MWKFVTVGFLMLFVASGSEAQAGAKIMKVLPHYLDLKGRESLSPSLFERDAYQQWLRKNPEERSGLRFDVHYKGTGAKGADLRMRVEVRASGNITSPALVLETPVKLTGWRSRWAALEVTGTEYERMGELIAWRATLWDGEKMLAEQRSFLW